MAAKFCKEGALKADMCCPPNVSFVKPVFRAFVQSIKKTKSFKLVYSCGHQCVNAYFVMYVLNNGLEVNRLGVSVSKKVGKAVIRNRVKRFVKESCRLMAHRVNNGFDIVIVARPAAGSLPKEGSFHKFSKSLESLFDKLQLFKEETSG